MKFNNIDNVKLINLKVLNSNNANLNIFENINDYFITKRIFTVVINDFNKDQRGRHAHKTDHQIISCPYGSIKFTVKDSINTKSFILNDQSQVIYVPCHIWTETDYLKKNTIVTCYCSNNYNEENYIRNYNDFLNFRKIKKKY